MTDWSWIYFTRPAGTADTYMRDLARGDVVAYEHARWHVLSSGPIEEPVDRRDWRVTLRPFGESLEWTAADNDLSLSGSGWLTRFPKYALPGNHQPVCSACGGPWPCRDLHLDRQTEASVKRAERYAMPGVCPACQEPVSTRQMRQTWPINLYALDPDQPVTFHLRRQCESDAIAYDEAYRESGRPGQLGYPNSTRSEKAR